MGEQRTDAEVSAQLAEGERIMRAAVAWGFAVANLCNRVGISFADTAARLEWLVADEMARSGCANWEATERLLALPRRELALAIARPSELGGVLFAPEPAPAVVSPETTAANDATAAADDAAMTEAAVQSEADAREPAPNDVRDDTPRPKKKR